MTVKYRLKDQPVTNQLHFCLTPTEEMGYHIETHWIGVTLTVCFSNLIHFLHVSAGCPFTGWRLGLWSVLWSRRRGPVMQMLRASGAGLWSSVFRQEWAVFIQPSLLLIKTADRLWKDPCCREECRHTVSAIVLVVCIKSLLLWLDPFTGLVTQRM